MAVFLFKKTIKAKIKRINKVVDSIDSSGYLRAPDSKTTKEEVITYEITIDKGIKDGVFWGLSFYYDEKNQYGIYIREVYENESIGFTTHFNENKHPINTEMNTKWE